MSDTNKELTREELEKKLKKVQEERDDYLSGWKREKADFENYKKEEADRIKKAEQKSREKLLSNILTVLDSFELSLLSDSDGVVEVEGVKIIKSQLENILKRHGLEKIKISPGDEFNPEIQEAVSRVDSDKPEGVIVNVQKPGYRVEDKVIRPAKVEVSKG